MARGTRSTTEATGTGRHLAWSFVGARSRDGRPLEFFTSIPARDLTERDVNALSDDDYAIVVASPLYEEAKESTAVAASPRLTKPKTTRAPRPTRTAKQPDPVVIVDESPTGKEEGSGSKPDTDPPADA